MSAYICSDRQFQAIAEYASEYMGANAQTVADVLKRENTRSVNTRYNEKIRFSKVAFKASNTVACSVLNNADIVALCECVNYQSCENNDYEQTIAASLLNMIKLHAYRASQLAGEKTKSTVWSI